MVRALRVNGQEFAPDHAGGITIGRDPACDVLVDEPLVSRRHAVITVGQRGWVLVDSGSRNGTFVDGQQVPELVVRDAVRARLGDAKTGAPLDLELVGDPTGASVTETAVRVPSTSGASAPVVPGSSGPAVILGAPFTPNDPAPVPLAFVPTHRVPAAGLATWPEADPAAPEGPRLEAGLEVALQRRSGDWAYVTCSNGWSAWVDGRLLDGPPVATAPPTTASVPRPLSLLAVLGAVLVVVSSFLPWFSTGGVSISAWDLPVRFLVLRTPGDTQPRVGLLLMTATLVLLPFLVRRPLPRWLVFTVAVVAFDLALFAVSRVLRPAPHPDLGAGVLVALVGGGLLLCEYWRRRRAGSPEPTP